MRTWIIASLFVLLGCNRPGESPRTPNVQREPGAAGAAMAHAGHEGQAAGEHANCGGNCGGGCQGNCGGGCGGGGGGGGCGCNHAAPAAGGQVAVPAAPSNGAPGEARRFGEALTSAATRAGLDQIARTPDTFRGQTVRVEGTVVAVCQSMGCWMEMRDQNTQAHVRMHGHSFFLPRDVSGRRAAVQGTIVSTRPTANGDPQAQANVAQIELDATGVEVYN